MNGIAHWDEWRSAFQDLAAYYIYDISYALQPISIANFLYCQAIYSFHHLSRRLFSFLKPPLEPWSSMWDIFGGGVEAEWIHLCKRLYVYITSHHIKASERCQMLNFPPVNCRLYACIAFRQGRVLDHARAVSLASCSPFTGHFYVQ